MIYARCFIRTTGQALKIKKAANESKGGEHNDIGYETKSNSNNSEY